MSFERRMAVVAGVATIASALMYAIDNDWLVDVHDLRLASKTIGFTSTDPAVPSIDASADTGATRLQPGVNVKPRPVKRVKRRVARPAKARRRTVNIFTSAKDIPHPNSQR